MGVFNVAILECDTPIQAVMNERGTYGDIIETFLRRGLEAYSRNSGRSVELRVTKFDVVNFGDFPDPEEVDCVVLSGSKHNAFADDAWILRLVGHVRKLIESSQPRLFGICFGHQIVGRALGTQIQRSPGGWEIAVDRVQLSQIGQKLFGVESLALHQMHRDAVLTLPDTTKCLGNSPACDIQGIYTENKILTLQGHPEFDSFIMTEILNLRHDQKLFDDSLWKWGLSRAEDKHDGLLVSETLWRFLLSDELSS